MPRAFKPPKKLKNSKMIPIDWKAVDKMLAEGCIGTEIAATLGMHPDTLYDRVHEERGVNFSAYRAEKCAVGERILRSVQFDEAVRCRNITMLIWLGKQRLNQNDKQNIEHSGQVPIQVVCYSNNPIKPWKSEEEKKPPSKS
jgi:hypothetical protein